MVTDDKTVQTEQITTPSPKSVTPPNPSKDAGWVADFLAEKENKPVETPVSQAKVEPIKEVVKTTVVAATKVAVEPQKTVEASKVESDSKRLKDTRDWASKVQQQNVELGQKLDIALTQMKTLQAKMDGTYEEPQEPTRTDIEKAAVDNTKLAASHYAAIEMLAAEGVADPENEVVNLVWGPEAPFQELQKDPAIMQRVTSAKLPVIEAIRVVREAEARKQYGGTPESMKAALRKEIEAEVEAETRKKVLAELKQTTPRRVVETVAGLSDVRGASREESKVSNDGPISMESLFPNFKK